jgi:alpha-glucosidase (family GH31 glycosyl hydrolase)
MNEPANLIENEKSKCKGEIVDEKECTKDKNKYDIDELPYIPGYRKGIKETLSSKSISENAIINKNYTVYDTKPLLSYFQVKHTYNYLKDNLQKRPFILSRSASLGSGKFTYHWSGDNLSSFGDLKNSISSIFNFNIFGIPFTGSDICGFMENASKELCLRWYNLGVFYPFSRNHNFLNAKEQYPWSFDEGKNDTINIIKKSINIRYSLLRYMYSQFFLISLNDKGSFFKPVMFEFPEEEASYEDIESKIMFGESFLIVAFYEENENNKKIEFPDNNFNIYPSGKSIIKGEKVEKSEKVENNNNSTNNSSNDEEEEDERDIDRYRYGDNEPRKKVVKKKNNRDKYIRELSGKLDEIHIFLRGGYIVPYQDVFNKYILNTLKLREEKINLIINIDPNGTSKGVIFFDNDGKDTVNNALYHKVDIFYSEKKMTFTTTKYNMTKYDYNDHILGVIEFWRASEVFKIQNEKDEKTKVIKSKITFNNNKNNPENIEGVYDKENNKAIFEISTAEKNISIFDIKEMVFN